MMYTADIEHVLVEAERYQKLLSMLQKREETAMSDYKIFWTQNMAGHAMVMRSELDLTEKALFMRANELANSKSFYPAFEIIIN